MFTQSTMHARKKVSARVITTSIALVAAAALTLTACSASGSSDKKTSTDGPVVNIGEVNQFDQGINADAADDEYDGVQLGIKYVESHGGLYNNGKIVITKATENGQPALVATSVRKLLTDNIKLLIGPSLTADCLGAAPLIDAAGAVGVMGCTTTSLTGADRVGKNLYRFETNDKLTSTALALKVAEKFKDATSMDVVAYDYLQGHEGVDTFKAALKAKGLNIPVNKEFFVAASTTNYAAQIGSLAQSTTDKKRILVLLTWGAGYLNFIQQAAPLKILDNYAGVFTTSMYYKSAVALKGSAPDVYNSYNTCYYSMWKNDMMTWFSAEMQKAHKRVPDDWSTHGFNSVIILAAAINKAKSTDSVKVGKALDTLKVDTASGTMTMNATTHQVDRQVPVCETTGDTKSEEGVKLLNSAVFSTKEMNL